jgi:hypothetical protein
MSGQSFNALGIQALKVTQYDSVGGYIAGTLTGQLEPADSVGMIYYPLTGSFKVKRTQ